MNGKRYVIDDTVLSYGLLSKIKLEGSEIIVPISTVKRLEKLAERGDRIAVKGMKELIKLRRELKDRVLVEEARGDEIDSMYELCKRHNATALTGNALRATALHSRGVKVIYLGPVEREKPSVLDLFDEDTMSIHLKEDAPIYAKKGKPGSFRLVKIREEPLEEEEILKMAHEILEYARTSSDAMIEIRAEGAYLIQMGEYRILLAFPPFSDGIEITAVRPVVKVSLEDYSLSDKLIKRLKERAEGIVIAGPPGAGKTTFASALAEFYRKDGKIVKTMESPRDLFVGPEITQYGKLDGSFEKTASILLLVRPDYVIFDEMRTSEDFAIFTDMRSAGIGMVGVVHCGAPIEAIQRFIRRVDLGLLPHVVDTLIFIKDGRVEKVYSLKIAVKLPRGMKDRTLARPVVLVTDFETSRHEYEIYTFGDEIVIMPVKGKGEKYLEEEQLRFSVIKRKNSVIVSLGREMAGTEVTLYSGEEELITTRADEKGRIVLARRSPVGRAILDAAKRGTLSVKASS